MCVSNVFTRIFGEKKKNYLFRTYREKERKETRILASFYTRCPHISFSLHGVSMYLSIHPGFLSWKRVMRWMEVESTFLGGGSHTYTTFVHSEKERKTEGENTSICRIGSSFIFMKIREEKRGLFFEKKFSLVVVEFSSVGNARDCDVYRLTDFRARLSSSSSRPKTSRITENRYSRRQPPYSITTEKTPSAGRILK